MTASVETATSAKERTLRFVRVISVHEEGDATVVVFLDEAGSHVQVSLPKTEIGFLFECFDRLYGGVHDA